MSGRNQLFYPGNGTQSKSFGLWKSKKQEAALALLLRLLLSLREVGVAKTQSCQNIQIWYYHQASFAIRDLLLPQENFQGVAMHSNDYTTPSQWKGKHGIIVGTANTGTSSAPIRCIWLMEQPTTLRRI
jgi:hypothetical protein